MILALKILLGVIVYFIIPVIIYSINDWFAGYFDDRLNVDMSIYDNNSLDDQLIPMHVFWPFVFIILAIIWPCSLIQIKLKKYDFKLDNMYKAGKAKRDRDQDLDYQAEKHLTGDK